MTDKVFYEELLPHEFQERIEACPVAYLPLGTLEWHGPQNALGADFIQARELFRRVASRFGGIVFPPLWQGPDRISHNPEGPDLIGMDSSFVTHPHRALPGSCYWVSDGLFLSQVEAILNQARRAGFTCILADGHGPSRNVWAAHADGWEKQFGIKLLSAVRDFEGRWFTQTDHAGKNETSLMLASAPELVDVSLLPEDRSIPVDAVSGEDPRDASASYGEELFEKTCSAVIDELTRFYPV